MVQWAVRVYLLRLADIEKKLNEPINPADPSSMTMAKVNDFIHEFRREEERKSA